MKTEIQRKIRDTLSHIVNMLVRNDFAGLEAISSGIRLKAEHIKSGVAEYGRTLVIPPEDAYQDIDVVQIAGKIPPAYSIRFRLFTKEEGRSDLELQATFIDDMTSNFMRVEIDDILVA